MHESPTNTTIHSNHTVEIIITPTRAVQSLSTALIISFKVDDVKVDTCLSVQACTKVCQRQAFNHPFCLSTTDAAVSQRQIIQLFVLPVVSFSQRFLQVQSIKKFCLQTLLQMSGCHTVSANVAVKLNNKTCAGLTRRTDAPLTASKSESGSYHRIF